MTQKWLDLTLGQKILFCLQLVLIVLFLILYSTVGRQQVLRHHGAALRRTESETAVVYSGKLAGQPISCKVRGTTVEYRYNDRTLHYTVTEDPTAVPPLGTDQLPEITRAQLIGVEIRKDGELLFRGGWFPLNDSVAVFNEDGSMFFDFFSSSSSDPNAADILRLIYAPNVTQRANPLGLLCGMILCIAGMVSLLYADALFRWNLAFRIRNAEDAEPSDWEIASRWISWLILTGAAIVVFILGLTGM